jgi:AraC-like DNA-binding protein
MSEIPRLDQALSHKSDLPPSSGPDSVSKLCFVEPSAVARRVLWHLFSVGNRSMKSPDYHRPFEKPGAHLFWVDSGEGELRLGSGNLPLSPGRRVWLVNMNQPRTYAPAPKKKLTIAGFRFGGPELDAWLELINGKHPSEIAVGHFGFFRSTLRELIRLAKRRPAGWEWQVHVTVNHVLGRILFTRNLLASARAELPSAVARVLDSIAADPLRDWKAAELADVARVSYSRLRELFHESQQGTIHQHIQRMRLDRARLLLADKGLSIKDVANQMHFSSEFYFSHFFKNLTSMSPRQYRESFESGMPA